MHKILVAPFLIYLLLKAIYRYMREKSHGMGIPVANTENETQSLVDPPQREAAGSFAGLHAVETICI